MAQLQIIVDGRTIHDETVKTVSSEQGIDGTISLSATYDAERFQRRSAQAPTGRFEDGPLKLATEENTNA